MKLGEVTFNNAKITRRDFAGKKFGPQYRTFSLIVEDPAVQQKLAELGVDLWYPESTANNAEPPKARMNVVVRNQFGDVEIVLIMPDGSAMKLPENNWGDLDSMWIKDTDLFINIVRVKTFQGVEKTVAYLKTLYTKVMSSEEREALMAERQTVDPVKAKYADLMRR